MKPEFVDNRHGNTLRTALRGHLDWLAHTYAQPIELSIATGYFNPQGFEMLSDYFHDLTRVRLLLGAEPCTPPTLPRRKPGDPRGERYDAAAIRQSLQALQQGLEDDRNILGFSSQVDLAVQHMLDLLRSGKVEVRRYEKSFLHGKAFIFSSEEGVICGSSNLTAAGLVSNLELNLGRYDPTPVRQVKGWFDELWQEAVPYDLAAIYAARYVEYDPYLLYLRVLWELYSDEMVKEHGKDSPIPLTNFQNDGIYRAKGILDQYHGVIIADGVGLGKTFIGGELLREVIEEHRQRALLISPAALRDGTWARFRDRFQLYFENISYEELAADVQLGGDQPHLKSKVDEYSLVVIDEAQAFRNPETRRAQALRQLLRGSPPKGLVLMSATPVNNSLWDLYYLLTYFVGHDAVFARRGIRSLKEHFARAVDQDPYDLRPDALFDILDAVTVRRTRQFVRNCYPDDHIHGPNGTLVPIRFPDPHVDKINYELDEVLPGFFEEFKQDLAPEEGEPRLTMARYGPSRYALQPDPEVVIRETALIGLLRSGLLKRFESSVYAFAQTTALMASAHEKFLAALDRGWVVTAGLVAEWAVPDNDEDWQSLLAEGNIVPVSHYDVARLRASVEKDRDLLRRYARLAGAVSRDRDPKLAALVKELVDITRQAAQAGIGAEDTRNKRKVVIFSYFADTVDWIEEHLLDIVADEPQLACYRGRMASVASVDSRNGVSRAGAIFGFAPVSTEAPPGCDQDLYDILISTDVLAEGQNLQQCCNVINYDLPWNPMRMVQRHGRIDRIGSPHRDVYIRCFFPDKRLDSLLDLEERIRRKLAQAAASIGIESEVIPKGATSEVTFTETREQIEALRREDPRIFVTAGEDPSAHSGEEYRQELRKGLDQRGAEIKRLPWAAGSGFALGARTGHFFCAKVGDHVFLRFVPADGDGELVRETLGCLRLIHCTVATPRHMLANLRERAYECWAIARRDIYEQWTEATDPAKLQPRVRPTFRQAAEHLRKHPPADVGHDELNRVLESVEAPWGARIEREFRSILTQEGKAAREISDEIVAKVRELGLQPFIPPEPLPVIEEDEVQLVCWLAVDRG